MDPYKGINTRSTPQTERALPTQVANSAGGFSFQVDEMQRALRFLILGSEGGSYYASEQALTRENAAVILDLAERRGTELVDLIRDVSVNGRAAKQAPTLFALAVCAGARNVATRQAALSVLSDVCRTGTMLFQFVGYVEQFRGWGRSLRTAVGNWYLSKDVDRLAYQAVKYRQREGWSHRDLLRLSHPSTTDSDRSDLFSWITHGTPAEDADVVRTGLPAIVTAHQKAMATTSESHWVDLVSEYNLPWEALPDAALKSNAVWEAMLPNMGITALIRNLGRLTSNGVIAPLGGDNTKLIADRLLDAEAIRRGRVHPLTILNALMTYQSGHGFRGNLSWNPSGRIVSALDEAFYLSFGTLTPAGKRTLIGLDVSGSMGVNIQNSALTARDAAAAMAMTVVRTEQDYAVCAFSDGRVSTYRWGGAYGGDGFTSMAITPNQRLDDVVRMTNSLSFGGTDCSLPMKFASQHKLVVDTFIVLTDSETYAGSPHPHQALEQYRQKSGVPARLIVVGMTSSGFTIANPADAGMLDVVGFDTATPDIVRGFSAGEF